MKWINGDVSHKRFVAWLVQNRACDEGIEWVRKNKYTAVQAWENCPNGEWMLWALDPETEAYDEMLDMCIAKLRNHKNVKRHQDCADWIRANYELMDVEESE